MRWVCMMAMGLVDSILLAARGKTFRA